nr:NADH dehydrogenase subunit 6 [Dianemobius fascipes nigrofasciatus]
MKMILLIMIFTNFIFLTLTHPLSITITIIIQSLSICLFMTLYMYSSWFSYILFLSFLGGMLVIFIYMTTLASNELMNLPKIPLLIFMFICSLFMIKYISFYPLFPLPKNSELMESYNNLTQMLMFPNITTCVMLIVYLLITMIAVIKISNMNQGTLRHSTYE